MVEAGDVVRDGASAARHVGEAVGRDIAKAASKLESMPVQRRVRALPTAKDLRAKCAACGNASSALDHSCINCQAITCLQCVAQLAEHKCPQCGEPCGAAMQMELQAVATYNIGRATFSAFWSELEVQGGSALGQMQEFAQSAATRVQDWATASEPPPPPLVRPTTPAPFAGAPFGGTPSTRTPGNSSDGFASVKPAEEDPLNRTQILPSMDSFIIIKPREPREPVEVRHAADASPPNAIISV